MPGVIKFLHPEFLYGLFILIIPIILHLFSFKRYKKVYFSNFNFLLSLQQEKKNSSRLKKLLLLMLRLLVLAFLIFAFAGPYIPAKDSTATNPDNGVVMVYIDNSFSMSNTGSHGSLLEESKKYIFDILNSYPQGTGFILLTNDPSYPTILSREEALNSIAIVRTTPAVKKLSAIFKEVKEIATGKPTTLFLLSDFQKYICDFPQIAPDSLISPIFFILKPENRSNLYIKDIDFEQSMLHRKNQTDKILIRVVNSSEKDFTNVPLTLTINEKTKNISRFNISANSEEVIEVNYLNTEDGFYKGRAEITDFPVIFDNKFYFSYDIEGKINVLCIEQNDHNPYFGKLFSDTTAFTFRYVNAAKTSDIQFNRYQLVILNKVGGLTSGLESGIENYVRAGGNLFVIPGDQLSVNVLNQLLRKMHGPEFGVKDTNMVTGKIEIQANLFKEVFEKYEDNPVLPYAKVFYPLKNTRNTEILLNDRKNHTVMASQSFGTGKVYVSAFDFTPSNSDMVYHPLFVPLMINASYNIQASLSTYGFIGSELPVVLPGKNIQENSRLLIRKDNSQIEFIPEIRKDFNGNYILMNMAHIEDADLYEVVQDGEVIDVLAFNFDRAESRLEYADEKELKKYFPDATVENIRTTQFNHNSEIIKEIVHQDKNKYLAGWLFLLAALTLFAEQFVWRKKLN